MINLVSEIIRYLSLFFISNIITATKLLRSKTTELEIYILNSRLGCVICFPFKCNMIMFISYLWIIFHVKNENT